MGKQIQIRNVRTGVVSSMDESQWDKIKDSKEWRGVFKPVVSPEPPEVSELREKRESSAKRKKEQNNEAETGEQ